LAIDDCRLQKINRQAAKVTKFAKVFLEKICRSPRPSMPFYLLSSITFSLLGVLTFLGVLAVSFGNRQLAIGGRQCS
jgi:hypothetical protein